MLYIYLLKIMLDNYMQMLHVYVEDNVFVVRWIDYIYCAFVSSIIVNN
jgi:hypothetical protein